MGMKRLRRIGICAMWVNIIAVSATAETSVITEPSCVGALQSVTAPLAIAQSREDQKAAQSVEVYYVDVAPGWASRRLFMALLDDNTPTLDDRRVVTIGGCKR